MLQADHEIHNIHVQHSTVHMLKPHQQLGIRTWQKLDTPLAPPHLLGTRGNLVQKADAVDLLLDEESVRDLRV